MDDYVYILTYELNEDEECTVVCGNLGSVFKEIERSVDCVPDDDNVYHAKYSVRMVRLAN